MSVETATYIASLDSTKPSGSDAKSEGDNHLRLLKSVLQATFPNLSAPVTVSASDLNSVTAKAATASPTFTGTPVAPTAAAGTNTTQLATTEFVTTAAAALVAGTLVDSLVKKGKLMFYAG